MGTMKNTALILALGLFLAHSRVSARKWSTDKDSIIVDATYVDDEEGELHFDALMDQAEQPECVTYDHEPGTCVPLRRCHPILFGDRGELRNPSLAETYSQNVDACGSSPHNEVDDEPLEGQENADEDFVRSAVPIANKAAIADKIMCCAKDKIQYAQRSLDDADESMYQTTTLLPNAAVAFGDNVEQAVTNFEELVEVESLPIENTESTVVQLQSENIGAVTEIPDAVEPQPPASPEPPSQPSPPPFSSPSTPEVPLPSSPVTPEVPSSTEQSSTSTQPSSTVLTPVENVESQNEIIQEVQQPSEEIESCPAVSAYNTWPSFENYPFLAAIQVRANTGPLCSGSLINSHYILTAAHCLHRFNSKDVARMQVRIGFTKNPANDTFNDFYMERKASRIIFHKRFHEQSKMDNNIALVQLDEPVSEFDEHVAPINIFNTVRGFDSGNCAGVEAGWIKYGNRKVTGISDGVIQYIEPPMSDFVLREAVNKIFTNSDCHRQLYTEITTDMLCAKTDSFEAHGVTADHFRGNDGGPLVIHAGNKVQQVGIKSWAYEGNQYPTVYTRVDKYLNWIKDNLEL